MNLEKLRDWLAKELRVESIPDQVWDLLVEKKYARENLDETDTETLVEQTRDLLSVSGPGQRRPGRPEKNYQEAGLSRWLDDVENERIRVFEEHVARMAAEHSDVQSFRREILGERFPLSYEEALEEFVDEDGVIRGPSPYAEQLTKLAKELARVYLWKEMSASWFVLAGYIPPVDTFNVTTSSQRYPHGPQVMTITLTVEPWLSAKKVQKIYKDIQDGILGKSNRRVGFKSLRLLEFVASYGSSWSWRELLERWNSTYPEWKFTIKNLQRDPDRAVKDFQAAYERARERVIEPRYEHGGGIGWSLYREDRQERIERALKGPGAEITMAEQRAQKYRARRKALSREFNARRKRGSGS